MPARRVVVPLLVLVLAAALWFWPEPGAEPVLDVTADTSACMSNLRRVYEGLLAYQSQHGHAPTASGHAFLQALIAEHAFEDTPETRAYLVCPGTRTPYAARDTGAHPLGRFPSGGAELEPLAACDGGKRLPHAGCVNVLYSDGSVQSLVLEQELESGRGPAGTESLPIGPESPVPDLRKLSAR